MSERNEFEWWLMNSQKRFSLSQWNDGWNVSKMDKMDVKEGMRYNWVNDNMIGDHNKMEQVIYRVSPLIGDQGKRMMIMYLQYVCHLFNIFINRLSRNPYLSLIDHHETLHIYWRGCRKRTQGAFHPENMRGSWYLWWKLVLLHLNVFRRNRKNIYFVQYTNRLPTFSLG